jgi:hypothetical protein
MDHSKQGDRSRFVLSHPSLHGVRAVRRFQAVKARAALVPLVLADLVVAVAQRKKTARFMWGICPTT